MPKRFFLLAISQNYNIYTTTGWISSCWHVCIIQEISHSNLPSCNQSHGMDSIHLNIKKEISFHWQVCFFFQSEWEDKFHTSGLQVLRVFFIPRKGDFHLCCNCLLLSIFSPPSTHHMMNVEHQLHHITSNHNNDTGGAQTMSTSFGSQACFFFFSFLFYLLTMRFFYSGCKLCRDTHCREQLLAGWERVPLQNSETTATPPPGQTERRDCDGTTRQLETRGKQRGGKANEKKAQETSFDVSWAVGKCFLYSCFIIFLLTIFLGTS